MGCRSANLDPSRWLKFFQTFTKKSTRFYRPTWCTKQWNPSWSITIEVSLREIVISYGDGELAPTTLDRGLSTRILHKWVTSVSFVQFRSLMPPKEHSLAHMLHIGSSHSSGETWSLMRTALVCPIKQKQIWIFLRSLTLIRLHICWKILTK